MLCVLPRPIASTMVCVRAALDGTVFWVKVAPACLGARAERWTRIPVARSWPCGIGACRTWATWRPPGMEGTRVSVRNIAFEGVSNVRDLGGVPVAGGRVVKPGLIFRSAALHSATQADCAKLGHDLGVRHVIDLRIGYEVQAKPDVSVPGARYQRIPFYDNEAIGYEYFDPIPGTIVIGKDFACNPDHFYADMANPLTAGQLRKLMHAIMDAALAGEPVLFHCSGGKDRAGITALLVLHLLGASKQAILDDYLLTNEARQVGIEKIYQRFLRLCQGNEAFAREVTENHCARPQNLQAFYASVDRRYGSMEAFVRNVLQFDQEHLEHLRQQLTVPAC